MKWLLSSVITITQYSIMLSLVLLFGIFAGCKSKSGDSGAGAPPFAQIVLSQAPASTTAGIGYQTQVQVLDDKGMPVTTYAGTVHFTSTDLKAYLPSDYTFGAADAGQHTFPNIVLKTAGSQSVTVYDLGFIDLQGLQSSTVVASSPSQLSLTGSSQGIAGISKSIVIMATDGYKNKNSSYRGTIHFTSTDPNAILPGDYTYNATDAGVHTFTITLNSAGNQTVTTTDTSDISITGNQVAKVNPTSASKLIFNSLGFTQTAGVSANLTIVAQDTYNNTALGYAAKVHFTSTDSNAILPADYTFTAQDAGIHTFPITFMSQGTQSITVTDNTTNHLTQSQGSIAVTYGTAHHYTITNVPSSSTAGVPNNITLTVKDVGNNIVANYTGTVGFTSSDTLGALPANYAFQLSDTGSAIFSINLKTSGNQTVTAKDTVVSSVTATTSAISILPANATAMFLSDYPSSVTAGMGNPLTLTTRDTYGNIAAGYRGTVSFSSTDLVAGLPANYTFLSSDSGIHTFSPILVTAGTQSITLKDTVTATLTATQSAITVGPANANAYVVTGFPASATSGVAYGTLNVRVNDAYGNIVPSYQGTVSFSSSAASASLPTAYAFTSGDAGAHTFTTTLTTQGVQSITATDQSNTSITGVQSGIFVHAFYLYVAHATSNNIDAFSINMNNGSLTRVTGASFASGTTPTYLAADTFGKFLYTSNAGSNNISGYTINSTTGALTAITGSPFTAGNSPQGITIDPTAKYLYVTNFNDNTVSAYTVNAATGALVTIVGSPYATSSGPMSVVINPAGKYLYTVNNNNNNMSGFTITTANGKLTALGGFPLALGAGTAPQWNIIDPLGKFLYTANYGTGRTSGYTINSGTGALTLIAGSPFAAGNAPTSLAIDPALGKYMYATNDTDKTLTGYQINSATGVLTAITGSPFTIPGVTTPNSVTIDPSSTFLYVSNTGSNNISGFQIDQATGSLSILAASPVASTNGPSQLLVVRE